MLPGYIVRSKLSAISQFLGVWVSSCGRAFRLAKGCRATSSRFRRVLSRTQRGVSARGSTGELPSSDGHSSPRLTATGSSLPTIGRPNSVRCGVAKEESPPNWKPESTNHFHGRAHLLAANCFSSRWVYHSGRPEVPPLSVTLLGTSWDVFTSRNHRVVLGFLVEISRHRDKPLAVTLAAARRPLVAAAKTDVCLVES